MLWRCCKVCVSHTTEAPPCRTRDNKTCNKVNMMTRTERVAVHKLLLSLQRHETHVLEVTLREGAEHHLAHRKSSRM